MKCEYTAEIYRALTKEEILNRYRNDPDYHSGKKNFALYEYWQILRNWRSCIAVHITILKN